jgi:tetratricopeptide (TPR) repeat protein
MALRVLARATALTAALGLCVAASACATYSDKTEAARASLMRGDYPGSLEQWNELLDVRDADEFPDEWKKEHALVVLERAMVLQAMQQYESSAKSFGAAEKQLEFLDLARDGAGKLGKYVYSDSATKYKTSPTEKLSLNAINLVNYLVQGDLSGAKVEAKRFTVMRTYMRDYDPEHEHGAFGSYVAGFVHERLGNADEALRYYDEALQERDFGSLIEPIARLAMRGSYRGERIRDYLPSDAPAVPRPETGASKEAGGDAGEAEPAKAPEAAPEQPAPPAAGQDAPPVQRPSVALGLARRETVAVDAWPDDARLYDEGSAAAPNGVLGALPLRVHVWGAPSSGGRGSSTEILVIAKTGRVPFKVPQRIPIGAAIGLAGAYVTGDTTLLEYGMFKVVVYPELVPARNLYADAELRIDGKVVPMDEASDLGAEIVAEYEEIKPKIIGAALSRMIVRAAAAEGARAGGNAAAKDSGAAGLVGFLAAAAIEGTMVALDKPDTRSWSTLPDKVHIGRAVVPAGAHTVEITVFGPGGKQRHTAELEVQEGGFAVVDVTTLR